MRARQVIGLVLIIVALPLVVIGLIDPLEGGIALIAGLLLGLVAWLVSRVPVPKFTWISLAATIAIGALTLVLAVTLPPIEMAPGMAANPVTGRWYLAAMNWVWRAGVLVTFAGAVWYIVRIVQALGRPTEHHEQASSGESGGKLPSDSRRTA